MPGLVSMPQPAGSPAEGKRQRRPTEEQPPPTPAEIRALCAAIQASWTETQRENRGWVKPVPPYEPPEFTLRELGLRA